MMYRDHASSNNTMLHGVLEITTNQLPIHDACAGICDIFPYQM
jgi:hypothetical protein